MNSMFNPFAGDGNGSSGTGGNVDLSNYYDKIEVDNIVNKAKYDDTTVKTAITTNITNIKNLSNSKQDKLIAGDNITITGNKISAKDTVYDDAAIKTSITQKQDKLSAGTGINISDDNIISSTIVNTDTKYGLSLSNGAVSLVEGGTDKSITLPTYDDSSIKTRLTSLENKTYDTKLNATSTNAVQNKTLYSIIGDINTVLDKLVSVE